MDQRIVIIGGGLVGASLACALAPLMAQALGMAPVQVQAVQVRVRASL